MPIYKDYDQAALDRQYNNRAMVPDFAVIVQRWQDESARLRQRTPPHRASYGDHEREYVDIFPAGQTGTPVQLFFHGGYWQALESSVFHFVAGGFIERGVTTVLANYPLAPQATMDEIVAACRRALAWLYRHAADHGGDPQRIHLSGHSAGGHIVAMLMATDWPQSGADLPANLIKGGCAISGLFDLIPIQLSYVNDQIGMDEATARRNSPLLLPPQCRSPLIVSVGGAESDEYHAQSRDFAAAWSAQGLPITTLTIAGANHFSILDSLVGRDGELNQAVFELVGRDI